MIENPDFMLSRLLWFGMDPLAQLLAHPQAEGAFALLMSMRGPWAVEVRDQAALTVMICRSGTGLVTMDADAEPLEPGDIALVRGPAPYRVSDTASSPTLAVIEADQRCITPDGQPLELAFAHGLRQWGNDPDGPDSIIVASYLDVGSVGRLVTDVLPPLAVVPAGVVDAGLVDLLGRELLADGLGQSAVLDRLIDVITIEAIRGWAATHPPRDAPWLAGIDDPVVRGTLDAIHVRPEDPWTVASLAAHAAVSRATLAARFSAAVGMPPLRYLTRWRLALARDLLADRSLTLDAIAGRVGYSSGFALSSAFTREHGISPAAHRRRAVNDPSRTSTALLPASAAGP